jgi:membrane protein YqaA with SNARE-associated domain
MNARDRALFGTPPPRRHWILPAGAWGFAEATLFFIVPDVLLTWIAIQRPNRALAACVIATVGALAGGAVTFAWGRADHVSARAAMEALPGISPALADRVEADLAERGLVALVVGPARGVPYKLYAAAWGANGGDLLPFLAVSVPARLARFAAIALLAAGLRAIVFARRSLATCRAIHVVAWVAFYAWYFLAMAG